MSELNFRKILSMLVRLSENSYRNSDGASQTSNWRLGGVGSESGDLQVIPALSLIKGPLIRQLSKRAAEA
jgi:hypothetical protein